MRSRKSRSCGGWASRTSPVRYSARFASCDPGQPARRSRRCARPPAGGPGSAASWSPAAQPSVRVTSACRARPREVHVASAAAARAASSSVKARSAVRICVMVPAIRYRCTGSRGSIRLSRTRRRLTPTSRSSSSSCRRHLRVGEPFDLVEHEHHRLVAVEQVGGQADDQVVAGRLPSPATPALCGSSTPARRRASVTKNQKSSGEPVASLEGQPDHPPRHTRPGPSSPRRASSSRTPRAR